MLYVHGVGHFHPENIIDNQFLESLDIGTSDQWILQRTGIRRRNTVLPLPYIAETRNRDSRGADEASLYSNAETGFRAAKMALQRAALQSSDIGMVIAGGSAPRMGSPPEACMIAEKLGIACPAFDLNAACPTFAVQLRLVSLMNPDSLTDFVLVVNPENLTRIVNYNDRSTAVLIGDCTTAAIVSSKVPARAVVKHSLHESDPLGWNKVTIPSTGHLSQDGSAVQNFAIRQSVSMVQSLRLQASGNTCFIGHQANLPMLKSVCNRAGIEPDRHFFNVDQQGNCGAAGAPSVFSTRWECWQPGDEIAMAIVGAGLGWAGLLISFAA
jgi:3-oxoacyl-[acyl-carrier-protein] synthase III